VRRPLPAIVPLPLLRRREPFDDRGWLFELKLDGFRALTYIERGEARLVSRNGNTFRKFPSLCDALARLRVRDAIIDGEVVCLDDDGHPSFDALYYRRREPCFFAFDLPWLDGRDLCDVPLLERKRALRRIVPRRAGAVRYVDHVRGRGVDLFRAVCELDLEGIVAKPAASAYRVNGSRPPWVKIKNSSYTRAEGRFERFERAARRRAR